MVGENLPRSLKWQPALEGWVPSALTTANLDDAAARLTVLDQRLLPHSIDYIDCFTSKQVCDTIEELAVRGAPAIGIAGAFALVLWAKNEWPVIREAKRQANPKSDVDSVTVFASKLEQRGREIAAVRPTAVNLTWAINELVAPLAWRRIGATTSNTSRPSSRSRPASSWRTRSTRASSSARTGAVIISTLAQRLERPLRIETHCNAGALATAAWGTATSIIYHAFENGDVEKVWVDETRPVEQGARLTAWELEQAGVPYTLISDSMAGSIMGQGLVDAVIVGADRVCANGDVANKIGTYPLAIVASYHGVPFFVAAPHSTFDKSLTTGDEVVIEQRDATEVRCMPYGHQWLPIAPTECDVFNPAFDITPNELITGVITETGIEFASE